MNNSSKRTISRILAFVMLVSCMFTNLIVANADTTDVLSNEVATGSAVETHTFDATLLTAAADKEAFSQADMDAVDSYFTVVGTITKRTSSGAVASVELAKNDGGQIQFTTTGDTASLSFDFSSTGSTNTSAYAVLDASGAAITEGEVTGSANGRTTVTVADLAPGTYSITSPDKGYNRGGRVYTITVVDGSADVPVEPDPVTEETTIEETTAEETTAEETTVEETTAEATETTTAAVVEPSVEESTVIIGDDAVNFEFWLDDVAQTITDETGAASQVVEPGTYVSGGSKVTLVPGINGEKYTQSYANAVGITRAGKVVNGYKAGSRPVECNAFTKLPEAGSCVIFEPSEVGTLTVYFCSTSFLRINDFVDGATTGYTESEVSADSYSIKVEPGHVYVASTTGKTNNMAYAGVEFVKDEPITVGVSYNNIDVTSSLDNLEVYITDANLGTQEAIVKTDTTSIGLAKGHTYKLTTNDGGVRATVAGSETFKAVDDSAIVIDLENIPDQTLTGTITGIDAADVTELTFTNNVNGTVVTATVNADGTYTATLKPGYYTTAVVTATGASTKDRVEVVEGAENVNEVYVEAPKSTGKFSPDEIAAVLPHTATVSSRGNDLTAKPGDTITVPVNGSAVVTVSSYYAAEFDINGEPCASTSGSTSQIDTFTYNATGDVTITFGGTATSYLTAIEITPVVPFVDTINVPGDYDTLKDAVTAIKGMERAEGEAGRVTINLTADIQEQVVIDAPYVTLMGNGHEISWYYGVGTFYYSIGSDGLYSETLFRDKYSSMEANSSLWGGVAIIRGDNFIAEDTIFRNTYNYSVTDKELEDIAYSVTGMPDRTAAGFDPTIYKAKERSNAFYIEAKNIECYNCQILSSQDTLGRNGSADNGYSAYFNNCVIGGNVDYICGEFAAVFDNCELQWKTYANDPANNAKVGYIVAPKTNPYVFRNCTITSSGLEGEDPVLGLYGRTWGANSNCSFINTETNGMIKAEGWGEMSAGDAATAKFYEYNNTVNGCYGFVYSTNVTASGAAVVADYIDTDTQTAKDTVLGGWEPVHYAFVPFEESTGTTESTTEATTQAAPGKDAWIAKDDPALAADGVAVTYAGGQKIFTGDRFDLVAGDGGATSGDVTITNEDLSTSVIGKYIKDTSSDAAGREMIDTTALGSAAATQPQKVRVVATAKSKCDGTLTVNLKANANKEIVFFDADTKECLYYEMVTELTDPYTVVLPIAAGQNISMGGVGTSPWFYDVTVSNEIEAGTDAWVAKEDPALAADNSPVTYNGGQTIFESQRLVLKAGDGGAVSGDVTITNEDLSTSVIGKYVKDTSSDAAGREMIDTTALGSTAATQPQKVRVFAVAEAGCDGTLTVSLKANANKEIVLFDTDTKTALYYEMVTELTDPYTVTLPVTAGQKVSLGGVGTSPWFYSVAVSNEAEEPTEATTEEPTEATTEEPTTEATTEAPTDEPTTESTTEEPTEATTTAPVISTGGWVAKDDPALAADNSPVTYAAGQTIYEDSSFVLRAGDGGAVSGDITVTNEDLSTTVIGKYVKDTSADGAGREFIDCSALGGAASAKIRVFATADSAIDGTLTVTLKANAGKEIVLFDADTKACVYYALVEALTDPYTVSVPIAAGQKISIGGIGTSPWMYSVSVSDGTTPAPSDEYPWGDVDHSKTVTSLDAALTLQYVLNPDKITGFYEDKADVNGDGSINSEDVAMILQKALDSTYKFPVEGDEPSTEATTEASTEEPAPASSGWVANDDPALAADGVAVTYAGGDVIYSDSNLVLTAGAGGATSGDITVTNEDLSTSVIGKYVKDTSSDAAGREMIDCAPLGGASDKLSKIRVFATAESAIDGTLTVTLKANANKEIVLFDADTKTCVYYQMVTEAADPYTITVPIAAGQKISIGGIGTSPWMYSVSVSNEKIDVTTEATTEATTLAPVDPISVYVVGDSTGCHYADTEDANYYYKRVGFGDGLPNYLREEATVVNLALSGRSSKSFTTEANYTTLKENIKAGDILLIAFGHNDEKADDSARYTFPSTADNPTTKDTEGSFKNSLYVNYIKLAQDAGATPIVCSPIVRRTTGSTWSDNCLHKANGGDYVADAKAVAEECGVPFLDLTGITQAKYDEMTPDNTVNLHAWTNSKATSVDNTHLNAYGAKEVAYLIALNAPEVLVPYVLPGIVEPTTADLVVNPDYQESSTDDLTAEELVSRLWTTTSPWYGTVFGDIGGNDKLNVVLTMADGSTKISDVLADKNSDGVTNFIIEENADGTVRVKAGDGEGNEIVDGCTFGKIAGTSDGLAMYYMPVDVQQNFSISAKAHVGSFGLDKNGQNSFGAIVADKVEVDKYDKIMIPNYVAAGPLKFTKDATTGEISATGWANFARIEEGALVQGGTTSTLPKAGDVIDIKITKVGSKYTAQYGDVISEFDVPMNGTVYVGVFAARCADITFSDINFNNEVTE